MYVTKDVLDFENDFFLTIQCYVFEILWIIKKIYSDFTEK